MLYTMYKEDGSIYNSVRVYDHSNLKDFEDQLASCGHERIIKHTQVPGLFHPDYHYYHDGLENITDRPWMDHVRVDKTLIKAGSDDAAIFTGIQSGTKVMVSAANALLHEFTVDQDKFELELHIPVPCTYLVTMLKWPYRNYVKNIQALAS